jgi:excisionase family DNA binding protein
MKTKPVIPATPPVANTVEVACCRLGICRATLYKAIKNGNIRTVKFYSRRMIPEDELQRVAREGF